MLNTDKRYYNVYLFITNLSVRQTDRSTKTHSQNQYYKEKNNVFSNKKVSIYQLLYFLELISVYSEQQYMQIMLDSCIPLLAVSANAHTDFPPERRFLLPIPLRLSA